MSERVNTIKPPPAPVSMGFYWKTNGPEVVYTYAGETFPYTPGLPGEPDKGVNTRYKSFSTVYVEPVKFEARNLAHSHVEPPPGVSILEYFWDFGDGATGTGKTVTHLYAVQNEQIEVSLTVVDSRGLRWSQSKSMLLVFEQLASKKLYRIRNKEGFNKEGH